MLVDFSKLNLAKRPTLILKTMSEKRLGVLGFAFNVKFKFAYNEFSQISFDIPAFVDGKKVPQYDEVVGWRIVELKGIGQFVLCNPSVEDTGIRTVKSCVAYSLEYELSAKNVLFEKDVYNFWNPAAPDTTILGILMKGMPSWKLGSVSPGLIGRYRTLEQTSGKVYNVIKSTLQKSYTCIFEFDSMTRTVNVRDTSEKTLTAPIYLSTRNLIKKLKISEDTDGIVTCLNVYGADDVDIVRVNPTGFNAIYNLDYFLNGVDISNETGAKWKAWSQSCDNYRLYHFDLLMDQSLQESKYIAEQSILTDLNTEMKHLEWERAGTIEAEEEGEFKKPELQKIKEQIDAVQVKISAQTAKMDAILVDINELAEQLAEINKELSFQSYFTPDELDELEKFFKEDSITESTFVEQTVKSYNTADMSNDVSNLSVTICQEEGMPSDAPGIEVTKVLGKHIFNKSLYTIRGGRIRCGDGLSTAVNRGTLESKPDNTFTLAAYLGAGVIGERKFSSGCVSMVGTLSSLSDNTVPDKDAPDAYAKGTSLAFQVTTGHLYFTENLTEYQQRAVEWDLLEYGLDTSKKLAFPAYTFSVDSGNFLTLKEFESFKAPLKLGGNVYLEIGKKKVLEPIVIGIEGSFADLQNFSITFSDKYLASDSSFQLADLLEQSISAGKNLDSNKFSYGAYVESGVSNSVDQMIQGSFDTAKNAIISSSGQAQTWDDSGIKLRKWNESKNGYLPEQIHMINNGIYFSGDGFESVNTALGKLKIGDAWMYGLNAQVILGKLLAGSNLVISSTKTDGQGNAVFKVDGNGVALHDASINLYNGSNTQFSIDPKFGMAAGTYPLYNKDGVINPDNAKLYYDIHKNMLTVGGIIRAEDFQDKGGNSLMNADKTKLSAEKGLDVYGLSVYKKGHVGDTSYRTFHIDNDGNVNMKGSIYLGAGSTIDWNGVNEANTDKNPAYQKIAGLVNDMDSLEGSVSSIGGRVSNLSGRVTEITDKILKTQIGSDYVISPTIAGSTITGGKIIGAQITGGSITANTTIDVGTDATIGNNLYLGQLAGGDIAKSIIFNSTARITSGKNTMQLQARTLYMNTSSLSFTSANFGGSVSISFAGCTLDFSGAIVNGLKHPEAIPPAPVG